MYKGLIGSLVLAVILGTSAVLLLAQGDTAASIKYASDGTLQVPDHTKWVFVGAGLFDAAQPGQNPRFSNVFVEPTAYDAFIRTGSWPNRTMILSEKKAAITTRPLTSGNGWGQTGDSLGAEVEVKDASKGGWVFYEVAAGERTGKPQPKAAPCYSCHAEKSGADNIFVQFYPALQAAAKQHGTFRATQ